MRAPCSLTAPPTSTALILTSQHCLCQGQSSSLGVGGSSWHCPWAEGPAPATRGRWGALTHEVADGRQLPILLHAHVAPIIGLEGHPSATPLHLKHGVGRAAGSRARSPQSSRTWGLRVRDTRHYSEPFSTPAGVGPWLGCTASSWCRRRSRWRLPCRGGEGAVVTMVEWTWLLHSHLCGRGLDAPVGDQGPVAPGAGVEGALFCLTVDFHQEGLMIQFLVLVG